MIKGYRRNNKTIGIRNHLLVLSTVVCANKVVENIASKLPMVKPITHPYGCGHLKPEEDKLRKTLIGLGRHPNVGGVLVVGLGCEEIPAESIAQQVRSAGKETESITIQDEGGTKRATAKGIELIDKLKQNINSMSKETIDVSNLTLGVECGGSDFSSGLATNPALGQVSDRLIDNGGRVMISETAEMLGTAQILRRRSRSEKVADDIEHILDNVEELAESKGVDIRGAQPSPGNIRGGLTTIEEKSLGAILKGGSRQIEEVVNYGTSPSRKGLVIMDTPGQDIESMTGMVAGGAQLIAFTTGRGTPTGNPLAPVIKITGNPRTADKMSYDVDIDVSNIISGRASITKMGKKIWEEIVKVINGKKTKSEKHGHNEIGINLSPTI